MRGLLQLLLIVTLIPAGLCASQTIVSGKQMDEDAKGFREFSNRIQQYMQMHNSVEAGLDRVKRADTPENINEHQRDLANGIRAARPQARQGDIFTEDAREAIRHAIRSVFKSVQADPALTTIRRGPPLKDIHMKVNEAFKEATPYPTVPPTLLMRLPPLPDALAFRIVGHDLVLLDVRAGLVVDFMIKAVPYDEK